MKKIGLTLCLLGALLVLGFLGLTYWVGVKAQAYYYDVLIQANRCWEATFVCSDYHHGLFSSTARTLIRLRHPSPKAEKSAPLSVELFHRIRHGPLPMWKEPDGKYRFTPLIATVNTRISSIAGSQGSVDEPFERLALKNFTMIHLGGGWETYLLGGATQDIGLANPGMGISWGGINGTVCAAAELDRWTGGFTLPTLTITGTEGRCCIEGAQCKFELHTENKGPLVGEMRLAIRHFDFGYETGKESRRCAGGNFESAVISRHQRDIVNTSIKLTVDPLEWNSALFGKGAMELELRNLAADGLARLPALFQDVQGIAYQLSMANRWEKTFAEGMRILAGFLEQSPEIELTKLNLETSKGNLSGTAKIVVDGRKTGSYPSPWILLTALFVDAQVSVSPDLLYYGALETNTPGLLDLFELRGETFKSRVSAREGRLLLNRRSFSLKEFIK